ncbi:MAG: hypothetical protein A2663_03550 [Candidatus Buchananbacteria bacterium RIFCSPHIGHO2_01_FULL_46_12]|uniref:Large polyvalent protein-associated domain-containing protein n=2 Tax=Candidatus Buchananiibacteriota TaxID=1817903 RepID=A0A1G1Y301_9BACT|nr:MAG: hypothetical protein A2663_03550 [Candidatus Buchananbacteria bacterium RIFCSPHIGHO2_01_FULL_46_12]OGY57991.1 MAG: hypothetical protein A3H67_03690 [Candidatus Buchananbacteria bacterium RIFCSPLOWO2_02_FULL_46_11b]
MEINNDKFEEIKNRAKDFYDKLDKIKCPYLGKDVHFNEEGFSHLLSKSWNRGRSLAEQYTRLKILPKMIEIIKLSHTLQEYDERQIFVRQKINSRWEKSLKMVRYYVFIALLKDYNFRLKIVIKEIEGGQPFFWSVYPSWKVIEDGNGNKKKIFYSGNLEED